jgi:CheY-specific phosphatase CheX
VPELDEDMVRDCLGEVVNVVAGHAKALLLNTRYHFTLSTPTLLAGGAPVRHGASCLVVAFGSDVGPFVLQLWAGLLGE